MSAAILPFPAQEPAVPIEELSPDELRELVDQGAEIMAAYHDPEERENLYWWQSLSVAERRRLMKRHGHPVSAWRAHKADRSRP